MTDLLRATHDAVVAALKVSSVTTLAPVFSNVPAGQKPPFIAVGAIDAERVGDIGGLERHSIEIEFQHRGQSKLPLFAMMAAARSAVEGGPLVSTGSILESARWQGSATDREEDGLTYHGIQRFELHAQETN